MIGPKTPAWFVSEVESYLKDLQNGDRDKVPFSIAA
jgi:hypothetical protein